MSASRFRLPAALACCCLAFACTDQKESRRAEVPGATSAGAAIPAARCYRSDGPILTRLAPDSREAARVAWLRLDETEDSGGGPALFVETGGGSLAARWSRHGDTLVIAGADDFIRISASLVEEGDALHGEAHAFSDAQLERAPSGDLVPAERRWRLVAEPAACDDAPAPWTARRAPLGFPQNPTPTPSVA